MKRTSHGVYYERSTISGRAGWVAAARRQRHAAPMPPSVRGPAACFSHGMAVTNAPDIFALRREKRPSRCRGMASNGRPWRAGELRAVFVVGATLVGAHFGEAFPVNLQEYFRSIQNGGATACFHVLPRFSAVPAVRARERGFSSQYVQPQAIFY